MFKVIGYVKYEFKFSLVLRFLTGRWTVGGWSVNLFGARLVGARCLVGRLIGGLCHVVGWSVVLRKPDIDVSFIIGRVMRAEQIITW